jgi:hypothetical protein
MSPSPVSSAWDAAGSAVISSLFSLHLERGSKSNRTPFLTLSRVRTLLSESRSRASSCQSACRSPQQCLSKPAARRDRSPQKRWAGPFPNPPTKRAALFQITSAGASDASDATCGANIYSRHVELRRRRPCPLALLLQATQRRT